MTLEAAMQGAAGKLRDGVAKATHNVIERQEGAAPELDDDRLLQPLTAPCCGAGSAPSRRRRWFAGRATWRRYSGSGRIGRQGRGCSLATLGARLEHAALFGRCREELLPQCILPFAGQGCTITLRDKTPKSL